VSILFKAGKCAEILKSNSVLSNEKSSQSFVDEFSKTLQENFHLDQITWNSFDSSSKPVQTPFLCFNLSYDHLDNPKNTFLISSFNQMQRFEPTLLEIKHQQLTLSSDANQTSTIETILFNFSKNIIRIKCQSVIHQLTNDILIRLQYLKHINTIRDFFLFENGSFMHQFALRLYSKLSQTIHERLDAFTVLVSFDSTLTMFGIDKDKYPLNVIFQSSNDLSRYIIQNVQLKYDLPKELHMIIQNEHMDIYQKCFAFVLQVKQAKYVLDQLVFNGKRSCRTVFVSCRFKCFFSFSKNFVRKLVFVIVISIVINRIIFIIKCFYFVLVYFTLSMLLIISS